MISARKTKQAGCRVGAPVAEVIHTECEAVRRSAGKAPGNSSVSSGRRQEEDQQTLWITYDVEIENTAVLYDVLRAQTMGGNLTMGVGMRWRDRQGCSRGAAVLGTMSQIRAGGTWRIRGQTEIPLCDLSGDTDLEVVLFGGAAALSEANSVTHGTVLAVLRKDSVHYPLPRRTAQAETAPEDSSVTLLGDRLQFGRNGPALPVCLESDVERPLWELECSERASGTESVDLACLRVVFNTKNPGWAQLQRDGFAGPLADEILAGILGAIVATVQQIRPYGRLAGSAERTPEHVDSLLRWIAEHYDLRSARTAADLAAVLRRPAFRPDAQIEWQELEVAQAKEICRSRSEASSEDSHRLVPDAADTTESILKLREALCSRAEEIFADQHWEHRQTSRGAAYVFDMEFALVLHEELARCGFSSLEASNDGIWRNLTVRVIPDVVARRLGGFPASRTYTEPRRNYLRMLWWYAHLSLQFDSRGNVDYQATRELLLRNTTDTIQQLVDRRGGGYDVRLCREIIRQHAAQARGDAVHRNVMRRVLERNVELTKTVEPSLYDGGVQQYVRDLFAAVGSGD